ncbi:DEAD/DEAH box helicase [Promicromonospora sp. MS192]|uniref:DEAD/DEAH box helicase n=1 Tax=Promicromonospora sp. MS192 TaxID=3412684 RepID=UPI003C3006B1
MVSEYDLAAGLPALPLRAMYSPKDRPGATFYVPVLTRAVTYDRAVGYWSSAELQYAAQGVAHFLANGGRMRLIVGAQLRRGDVDAVLAGEPLDQVLVRRLMSDPGLAGAKIVRDEALSVLAWMVKHDRLELKVGVPMHDDGRLLTHKESGKYFHTKYGIVTDELGNKVAWDGSNNASVTAWALNHETFHVFPSWMPSIWEWVGKVTETAFEELWSGSPDPGWAVVSLPEAVRQHLIEHAPDSAPFPDAVPETEGDAEDEAEPDDVGEEDLEAAWAELVALAEAPRRGDWTAVGTAAVEPLPHQARLVDRVVSTFPRGYLLADEVGLGKTVEAGLVVRELLLSGKAKNALLLVPASVMVQWQEELHEKLSLDIVRYDKGVFLDRHGSEVEPAPGANPWSAFPVVLASSHLARRRSRRAQLLSAGPWDVVLVDEAHHARRRGSKPNDPPNSLLGLLQEMRQRKSWKALYLASATPMQMNPHEAWDLISLLGLPGAWGESALMFLRYFGTLSTEEPKLRDWSLLSRMLGDYFTDPLAERDEKLADSISDELGFVDGYTVTDMHHAPPSADAIAAMPNAMSYWADLWLRRHTPMRDRAFRNTRKTLRAYQKAGIIPPEVVIPVRTVNDEFIELAANERKLYERIEEYIRRHYNAYMTGGNKQALGFIMTVYRRRLTSSFAAITKSLQRRLDVLEHHKSLDALFTDDDRREIEDTLLDPETFDESAERLVDEIGELRNFVHELEQITAEDTKASRLIDDVRKSVLEGYSSVVVFTQYFDTLEYVRERLLAAGIVKIGCYSGAGGEVWDAATGTWDQKTKAEIKTAFRAGELEALIGTDSMSEGLNLQTSGRLINYDMPWNLMRVEQRIGRVDRIGASYEEIKVSNYFYADTVEEQVYKGIKEDYGDFTNIVGEASPVLATVEMQIEQLALGEGSRGEVNAAVRQIKDETTALQERAVKSGDLGAPADEDVQEPPQLSGHVVLRDLERVLTTNRLTAGLFEPTTVDGVYRLELPRKAANHSLAADTGRASVDEYSRDGWETRHITFDRGVADAAASDVVLLTYGAPELEAILPVRTDD